MGTLLAVPVTASAMDAVGIWKRELPDPEPDPDESEPTAGPDVATS